MNGTNFVIGSLPKFFRIDIKNVTIILLVCLLFISTSWPHEKISTTKQFEFCLIKNPNSTFYQNPSIYWANQNLKLKFTVSDSWFGRDKVHHFLTSAFLSSAGYYFFHEEQNFSNFKSQQGGFCFSISLGLIKEIRDGFKTNNAFSVKDFVADILGTMLGIVLISDL